MTFDAVIDPSLAEEPVCLRQHKGAHILLRGSGAGVRFTIRVPSASLVRYATGPGGWCVALGSPLHTGGASVEEVLERTVDKRAGPAEGLTALDGAFVAFHLHSEGELTVVTDALGLQPLFRTRDGERTVYGSSIRRTLGAAELPLEEDLAGTGALLVLGHMLGDGTVAAGVERVPPASLVRHRGGRVSARTWWRLPTMIDDDAPSGEHVEAVAQSLHEWYTASRREYEVGTLLLSGGFDSRLAAGLLMSSRESPRVVCLRHRDQNADADYRVARAVCRAMGLRPEVIDPPADYYDSEAYAEYVHLTEGATTSLFLFIATLSLARTSVVGAAWDGLLPGFLNVAPYEQRGFEPYLSYLVGTGFETLKRGPFQPDWIEACLSSTRALLDEEVRAWPDGPSGVLGFGLRNRARLRFAPNPLSVLGSRVPLHLPGATRAFWEAVSRVPPLQRSGGRMHTALLERLAPPLMRLPIVSGSKVVSPPHGGSITTRRLRLAARVDHSLRRGRLERLASRLGIVPFTWEPSARAMEDVRLSLGDSVTYDTDRLASIVRGREFVAVSDRDLFPVIHRRRALQEAAPAFF